jgi:hypothetical protein
MTVMEAGDDRRRGWGVTGMEGRPAWWTSRVGERDVLLSLAATPGPLPAAVATRLAEGSHPASLLRAHSPEPVAVAERLDALGVRLMVPGDEGWPLDATPPDPPCAWLFVAGPAPPPAMASVAVVGGRRASPLRRAAARAVGAGLARAGWCVVSGGAKVLWSLIVLLDRVLPHATHHRDTPLGGLL